jgi:hypothetical protein
VLAAEARWPYREVLSFTQFELVGAAREGLLALSVGIGLSVVHELMEAEVTEVVGPKGKWKADAQRSVMATRTVR